MYYHFYTKEEDTDEEYLKKKREELAKELEIWEKYLEGNFIAGPDFTMADIYVFTYLAVLVRGSLPLDARPNIKKYYESLCKRPSIQASWPPSYKESSPTQIFAGV
ncbi:glutathione S-transferase A-like [Hydractinia symbiolongicarpus]|uniref:glutathione S-transferase A-like n=1 Tax=Hydractinia symbiolongicarpus TaxID=13093 RepID=UPI00254BE649|nr:glutathione S-transferase A-like [Hydractinia symbiolongicarpus]